MPPVKSDAWPLMLLPPVMLVDHTAISMNAKVIGVSILIWRTRALGGSRCCWPLFTSGLEPHVITMILHSDAQDIRRRGRGSIKPNGDGIRSETGITNFSALLPGSRA